MLFAGDLFEAIPFGDQPTVIYIGEEEPVAGRHVAGEVTFGYGLLITPTCDMTDQHVGGSAHPYRVLVAVLPLRFVAEQTGGVSDNESCHGAATPSIPTGTCRRSRTSSTNRAWPASSARVSSAMSCSPTRRDG
jgi:hypothetical protein